MLPVVPVMKMVFLDIPIASLRKRGDGS
jgi:hypothetical protein